MPKTCPHNRPHRQRQDGVQQGCEQRCTVTLGTASERQDERASTAPVLRSGFLACRTSTPPVSTLSPGTDFFPFSLTAPPSSILRQARRQPPTTAAPSPSLSPFPFFPPPSSRRQLWLKRRRTRTIFAVGKSAELSSILRRTSSTMCAAITSVRPPSAPFSVSSRLTFPTLLLSLPGRKSAGTLSLECKWTGCHAKASKRDHLTSHCRVHIALKPHVCSVRPFPVFPSAAFLCADPTPLYRSAPRLSSVLRT